MLTNLHSQRVLTRVSQRLWVALFALLVSVGLAATSAFAQQTPRVWNPSDSDPGYDTRKLQQAASQPSLGTVAPVYTNVDRPSCFEPFSNTGADGWTALPRNDDGSIGPIALGWDFSLFGTVYNSVYINNNGNVTFSSPLSEYTPGGFPIGTPMVAAFWGDVDTRNSASGQVWYKVFSDRLVVTYDHVGYYNGQADKTNTFQLIIKANTVPGFTGNDVIFAYEDMQWTTGSASGGVGGFGGAPATVGANRGNNVDYIQTGRFNINSNQPPNVPNVGDPGGVSYLDGLCIGYQVRGVGGNIPPSVAGLPDNNTITLNQGETRTLSLQFSGPETNQNVNVTTTSGGLCSTTATTAGNDTPNPTVTFAVTGASCNAGTNTVSFTATDTGTPTGTQTFTITVIVNPGDGGNLPPTISGMPPGNTITLNQDESRTLSLQFAGPEANQTVNVSTNTNGVCSTTATTAGNDTPNPTITFTAMGSACNIGTNTVTFTATDNGAPVRSQTFTLTIIVNPGGGGGSFAITGATTVSCEQVNAYERRLTFTPQYTGLTGAPVSFSVVNEMPATTNPGPYTLRVYTDNPTISLRAQQGSDMASYDYNWLAVCGTPPPPSTFSITGVTLVSCEQVTTYERRLTFNPLYTGVNGTPISFSVVNEMPATTAPGPYTLRVYIDNPTISLRAQQGSDMAAYDYNWLAVCSSGARLSAESTATLSVVVLGNPVAGETVEVEVRGATGQPLRLQLTDIRGRTISETQIERATSGQRATLPMGRQPGLYVLQATTPAQKQTLKLLKP